MKKYKTTEEFIAGHPHWQQLLVSLRNICLSTELEETIKWSVPVYTLEGKNVAGLMAFKNHAAIWFFQGALLKDEAKQLVNAQEGVTKAQRQWRFVATDEIDEELIRAYLDEAISNQKMGKTVKVARKKVLSLPGELSAAFDNDTKLKTSFYALSPFRQREYGRLLELMGDERRHPRFINCPTVHAAICLHFIFQSFVENRYLHVG